MLTFLVYFEYSFMYGGVSESADNKFWGDWFWVIFLVSSLASFLVAIFGWAILVRMFNWLALQIGVKNFNRTAKLRVAGTFFIVGNAGFAILSAVRLLARLGF